MSTVYPTSLIKKLPYITVSPKGLSNGLSDIPNDGADFGPDTLQGSTSPGYYGPPYTQTSGIQEAANYLLPGGGGEILLKRGIYLIDTTIFINSISAGNGTLPHPTFYIHGEGANIAGNIQKYPVGTWIQPSSTFDTSAFGGWLMVTNFTDNSEISHIGFLGMNPVGNKVASGLLSLGDYNIKITKNMAYDCVNGFWATSSGNAGQIPIIAENQTVGCTNYAFASQEITINGKTYSAFAGDGGVSQGRFINNYDAASNISYWLHGRENNASGYAIIAEGNVSDQPIGEGYHIFRHTLLKNCKVTIISSNLQSANAKAIVLDNTTYPVNYCRIENFTLTDNLTTTNQSVIQTTGGTNSVDFELISPQIYEAGTSTTNPIYNGTGTIRIEGGNITSNRQLTNTANSTLIQNGLRFYNYSSGNLQIVPTSVTSGTTAGNISFLLTEYSSNLKKYVITFSGYENDTTTNQTISFPVQFSSYAVITGNNTGLTISASTTGITITSPNSTTTYSGIVIVEGY